MAGFSKYPNQIDSSTELPVTTDNVTPVKAEVVNRLRDAILAIESELGIDPSREYGTVRARLDAMQTGSGGGGAVEILQNGVEVLPSAIALDFVGNVNVTISQPLRARIQVIGGQATQVQETIPVNFNGQTIFTLSQEPIQDDGVMMFIDGIKQQRGVDYTSFDTTATYTGTIPLITADKVEFWYLVDLGEIGGGGGSVTVQDDGVTVDTETTLFNFTGNISATSIGAGQVEINVPDSAVTVQEDGYDVDTNTRIFNFTGNIDVTDTVSGEVEVNVPFATTVQEDGYNVDIAVGLFNFTGNVDVTDTASGEVEINIPFSTVVQDEGIDVASAVETFNFTGGISASETTPGEVEINVVIPTRIRVFRSTTDLAGGAVTVNQTVTWNGTSSLVTVVDGYVTGTNTKLSPTHTGHFLVTGQLTIQPTVDAINGITVEVLRNGSTVVHTVSDYGAVWGVGINRSLSFAFPMDLVSGETLEVRWRHSGSATSTQKLVFGDNLSWFAISEQ